MVPPRPGSRDTVATTREVGVVDTDVLAVLNRVVGELHDLVLADPVVICPGATVVALADALDLLHTDPDAGEVELGVLRAGLTELAGLLADRDTRAVAAGLATEGGRAVDRLTAP